QRRLRAEEDGAPRVGAPVDPHRDEAAERRDPQVRDDLLAVEVRRVDLELREMLHVFAGQRIPSSPARWAPREGRVPAEARTPPGFAAARPFRLDAKDAPDRPAPLTG